MPDESLYTLRVASDRSEKKENCEHDVGRNSERPHMGTSRCRRVFADRSKITVLFTFSSQFSGKHIYHLASEKTESKKQHNTKVS